MILDVGKTYNFYFYAGETSWDKRGEVVAVEGCLAKIKDEHGREELLNLSHPHFESAREWKLVSAPATIEIFGDD